MSVRSEALSQPQGGTICKGGGHPPHPNLRGEEKPHTWLVQAASADICIGAQHVAKVRVGARTGLKGITYIQIVGMPSNVGLINQWGKMAHDGTYPLQLDYLYTLSSGLDTDLCVDLPVN